MTKRKTPMGSSLDLDKDGDPKAEGFGEKLSRDLEIEREMSTLDTLAPSRVRKAWAKTKRDRRPR